MRTINLIISIMLVLSLSSCGNDTPENPADRKERPEMETLAMNILVGETALNSLVKGEKLTVMSVTPNDVVSVKVEKKTLEVKGLSAGKADIKLNADGMNLVCSVTVTLFNDPNEDEPEDIGNQLTDGSMRVDFGQLKLDYSTPGTLFMATPDSTSFRIVSLTSGTNIDFSCSTPLRFSNKVSTSPSPIPAPQLKFNGEEIDVEKAELYRVNANSLHIRVVNKHQSPCWIVISSNRRSV